MPELTDTSEKGLEALIAQHLCLMNGFEERHFAQYNRSECVDEELLFKFLEDTQPKEETKPRHQLQATHFIPC